MWLVLVKLTRQTKKGDRSRKRTEKPSDKKCWNNRYVAIN
jgi:hypothetical protein